MTLERPSGLSEDDVRRWGEWIEKGAVLAAVKPQAASHEEIAEAVAAEEVPPDVIELSESDYLYDLTDKVPVVASPVKQTPVAAPQSPAGEGRQV